MNESEHGIPKQIRVFSVVKAPCHFVQVGLQVFRRDFVPRPNDPALEQREGRFHAIRMEYAVYILLRAVIHDVMLRCWHGSLAEGGRIRHKVIRHDHVNVGRDVLSNVLRQCAALGVLSVEETEIAAALTNADHYFFRILASPHAFADLLSAYVCFVYFADTVHLWFAYLLYSMAYAMTEIPCRPVVNFQHPMKLVGAHPLLRLADQIDSKEPFRERQVCVMEYRSSRYRELVAA